MLPLNTWDTASERLQLQNQECKSNIIIHLSQILHSPLVSFGLCGLRWTACQHLPPLCLSVASRASAATSGAAISRCFLLPNIISHNNIGQLAAGPVVMIPRSPKGHCGHNYSNFTGGILYWYLAAYFSLVFLSLVCMSYGCSFNLLLLGRTKMQFTWGGRDLQRYMSLKE